MRYVKDSGRESVKDVSNHARAHAYATRAQTGTRPLASVWMHGAIGKHIKGPQAKYPTLNVRQAMQGSRLYEFNVCFHPFKIVNFWIPY